MSTRKRSIFCSSVTGGLALLASAGAAFGQARPQARPFDDAAFGAPSISFVIPWSGAVPVDGTGPGVQAAADHIIDQQCLDGGWGWEHYACPVTANNITAPICLGLLRSWAMTGDTATLDAAVAGGDFDLTYLYGNGEARFSAGTAYFLWALTQATGDTTYSDYAATEFFDELTAKTYGPSDLDTAGWIGAVQAARTGVWINLRPWEFPTIAYVSGIIGNADSTTPPDVISQQDKFVEAVLDGLDTLDSTDASTAYYDLIGLAGGIRGLALTGTTSFAPISSPNSAIIDGIDDLCDLADVLAGLQNPDGSWYWHSDLSVYGGPTESDKDTQVTAYAILALLAADDAGCTPLPGGRYTDEINKGREWLDSMQDPDGGYPSYPGGTHNVEVEGEATDAVSVAPLSLTTSDCSDDGTITVSIDMAAMPDDVVGGQFFLEFDPSLTLFSAVPGDSPFTVEVFELPVGTTIAYAVGVDGGGPGTSVATTMAVLTFTAAGEICTPTADLVTWDHAHSPPSRLTNDIGDAILPTLIDLNAVTVDTTPPDITDPADIEVNADAGFCTADVTVPALVASDACTGVDTIINDYNGTSDASDNYPSGTTIVTWTVTDNCGNENTETQEITVNAVNNMLVDVQLFGVTETTLTRCITFELFETGCGASVEVEKEITFTSGLASGAAVEVPCGDYTCITARDTLHTLKRTDDDGDFAISGTDYVASFTTVANGSATDDSLTGGNLNDDDVIDILDFGVFVGEYNEDYGTGDTTCATAFPHADLSGDGLVTAADYTFITNNFLEFDETDCCVILLAGRWHGAFLKAPVTRISVDQLQRQGMGELAVADLNHDGWLDTADVQAFLEGARP